MRHGLLARVHPGVYRIASHPESFDQRCLAVCLAAPHHTLSGPTAGRVLGLRKVGTTDVHVIGRGTLVLDGVVAHRTTYLSNAHVQRHGPLRVLRPARLACDLASFLDDESLESVIEQMLDHRLVQVGTLRDMAREFSRSGRNGCARLTRVLDGRPTWRRPADSDLEVRLGRALARAGLELQTQVPVTLDNGHVVHIDLADPLRRFGVEVDHVTWHGGRLDVQRDKSRDRELMRLGWRIARVTDEDIDRRLDQTVAVLIEIAAAR